MGLSNRARSLRRQRNFVNFRINALISLVEVCSYLVIIPGGNFCRVLYLLIDGQDKEMFC